MRPVNWLLSAVLTFAVSVAAGCGGAGPSSGAGAAPATAKEVTGVAATGAPIAFGTVYLKDSSVTPKELHQSTRSDGSFAFDANGLTPPFMLKTVGTNQNLYSIASDFGMTNITPLTGMVVAQAAQRDDLEALYGSYKPADLQAIAQKMPAADKTIQNLFAPLMTGFSVTTLVNGPFSANGTGYDALLDTISVSVVPGAVTVTLKTGNMLALNVPARQLGSASLATGAPATPAPAVAALGSDLYSANCAGCHGASSNSNLIGRITVATAQNAISTNLGGMGMLSGLSAANLQAISSYLGASAPVSVPTPPPATVPVASTDGAALYDSQCADCHGPLASSSKQGITVARLQNAVASNAGGMGSLSLSAADMQSLAAALTVQVSAPVPTPSPTPAPVPVTPADGAALYAAKCAGCHGSLASSTKIGITIVRLQNAIGGNIGGMGFLSTLASSDLQALTTALNPAAPTPAPTPTPVSDGTALYAANCAGCHGSLAASSKKGITIARLQSAIGSNTGGMGFLSNLTVNDVQALVTVLTPATPTPTPTPAVDGPTLYNNNCAACHGPLASSTKAGRTANQIQAAINSNTGSMGSLTTLSSAQIAAIASALPAAAPAPAPAPTPSTDGVALYASSCAGCHGALAQSSKAGKSAGQIQAAINSNTGSMGSLSSLTAAQVAAIGTTLATVAPSPTPAPACGSCHAIPPATGHHSKHKSQGIACSTCHGAGYSTTAFNAATHNNGVTNLDTAKTGWKPATRTCANSCHGSEKW